MGWARSQLGKVLVLNLVWTMQRCVSRLGRVRSRKYCHSWHGSNWPLYTTVEVDSEQM